MLTCLAVKAVLDSVLQRRTVIFSAKSGDVGGGVRKSNVQSDFTHRRQGAYQQRQGSVQPGVEQVFMRGISCLLLEERAEPGNAQTRLPGHLFQGERLWKMPFYIADGGIDYVGGGSSLIGKQQSHQFCELG